jgi:hypothetical protein
MPGELDDAIEQNAKGPAKASGDAGSVEQHKLAEQIEADRYARRDPNRQPRVYGVPGQLPVRIELSKNGSPGNSLRGRLPQKALAA